MKKISTLETHIGYWARLVSNQVSQTFAQRLEGYGVTVAEWVILRHLYETRDTQARTLTENTGLTKGAISKLIARLENKKLLARRADTSDQRSEKINLTLKGSELVPELARTADRNDVQFFSCLTAQENKTLADLLKKVAAANKITVTPIR